MRIVMSATLLGTLLLASSPGAQTVPTSISSNFNGTAIPMPRTIWFNAHLKYTGPLTNPVTLRFTNAVINFTAGVTPYSLSVPDGHVILSPSASSASTVFNTALNRWETTVPSSENGDIFIQGLGYPVPVNFPGGINPVSWSADFSSDTQNACINWQWAAAVYTQFSTDNNVIGVAPIDDTYQAGTPVNYRTFVTGGARGGGGSNFTGSNSGTGSACIEEPLPVQPITWGQLKARIQ